MTYKEKLLDPRWQRKRLEIMGRDGFKCQSCQKDDVTLHVHHKFYTYGKNPWDYDNGALITLCSNCHQDEEDDKQSFNEMFRTLLQRGYTYAQLAQILFGLESDVPGYDKEDRVFYGCWAMKHKTCLDQAKDEINKDNPF